MQRKDWIKLMSLIDEELSKRNNLMEIFMDIAKRKNNVEFVWLSGKHPVFALISKHQPCNYYLLGVNAVSNGCIHYMLRDFRALDVLEEDEEPSGFLYYDFVAKIRSNTKNVILV